MLFPDLSADPTDDALPPREWVERALLLIGRTHKGATAQALAASQELDRWRQDGPLRARAVQAAQHLWDLTDGSALRESMPTPARAPSLPARRRAVGLLGVAALIGGLGAGSRWYWRQPLYHATLGTARGELSERTLPDGTVLNLAPRTTLAVSYHRDRRELRLDQGEVRLSVQHDADRPFTVVTDWGRVRVLGTVFSVSAREGRMRVAVAEGRVAVWGARHPGTALDAGDAPGAVLGAGQSIQTLEGPGLAERTTVQADEVGAWRQGWLVFDNQPLAEVVSVWNDYLPQPIRLGTSPVLSRLRLTGSFPLREPRSFLEGLPHMLAVRVVRHPDGVVEIDARP